MSGIVSSQVAPLPVKFKGDIIAHDGSKPVRVPVGPDGYVLVTDSLAPGGVSWQEAQASEHDHHSGFYYIPTGVTVTISENKQSVVFGMLDIDGLLIIDGQLIKEP